MKAPASKTGVLERNVEAMVGPYDSFAKATSVADGLAGRLAVALSLRNIDPAGADMRLIEAFAVWPVLCRVMVELEAAFPEQAGRGQADARRVLDMLDRRDRTGDYA
ncbi:MAG: hypothetical protein DCF29_08040 [Alphaproteobacteria bacterium]|nr:MAG: hypothetical protein DCF29_08040 [Alphaproteobacteria bacterium]